MLYKLASNTNSTFFFLLHRKRLAEDMFDIAEPVSCVLAGSQIVLLLNCRFTKDYLFL
jgi:hypothetical protein